jgi:hypothetical protein
MEMDLSIQQTELPKWHMAISDPPITNQMDCRPRESGRCARSSGRRSKQMSRRYLSADFFPQRLREAPPSCLQIISPMIEVSAENALSPKDATGVRAILAEALCWHAV